MSAIRWMYTHM